jgi:protein TonB
MSAAAADRLQGAAIVAAIHVAAVAALLYYQPARQALASTMPVMVSLVMPEAAEPPKAKAQPAPRPKPAPAPERPRAPEPLPVVAARADAVVADAAPVPAPEPKAVEAPAVLPAPAALAAAPVASAVAVIPPRFDAAYLDNPVPAYPSLSRRMREQGRVVLRVLVTPAGSPERVELRASSGSVRLDGAALDTVKRWRFVPARQGADAVAAWVLVPISFALEG